MHPLETEGKSVGMKSPWVSRCLWLVVLTTTLVLSSRAEATPFFTVTDLGTLGGDRAEGFDPTSPAKLRVSPR